MRRVIIALMLLVLLAAPAAAVTEIMAYSSTTFTTGTTWNTNAVKHTDSPNMSIAVGFRTATGTITGTVNVKLQGSMDGANWVDINSSPWAGPSLVASTHYIMSSAIVVNYLGGTTPFAGLPAPFLRLAITNNSGISLTLAKAAWIHYQ